VFNTQSILDYFSFSRGFWATFGILAAYLAVVHVATFCSMLLVARRERR
jgi:hypothetical protein